MADYTDTEKLIDNIRIYKGIYKADSITFDAIAKIIESQPSVDAVEVVRCRDCRFNEDGVCERMMYWHPKWGLSVQYIEDDDFCAWGKRREENE